METCLQQGLEEEVLPHKSQPKGEGDEEQTIKKAFG